MFPRTFIYFSRFLSHSLITIHSFWAGLKRPKLLPPSLGHRFLTPTSTWDLRSLPFLSRRGDLEGLPYVRMTTELKSGTLVTLGKVWRLKSLIFHCVKTTELGHSNTVIQCCRYLLIMTWHRTKEKHTSRKSLTDTMCSSFLIEYLLVYTLNSRISIHSKQVF